jgi:hypothetical protein
MGRIHVKAKLKRGRKSINSSMLVDSGADATMLNLDEACKLGLDPERAEVQTITAAGGAKLQAYRMANVSIAVGKRKAVLEEVYVPAMIIEGQGTNRRFKQIREESMLGHDFMQKSKSVIDYETHELRGYQTVRLRPELNPRPASAVMAKQVREFARCKRPTRK